jgi:hypothetical protein
MKHSRVFYYCWWIFLTLIAIASAVIAVLNYRVLFFAMLRKK